MKHYYLIIFTLLSLSVTAQIPTSLSTLKQRSNIFDEYEGSIYETLKFQQSTLTDENSSSYQVRLRYDIYNDAIEFKNDESYFEIAKNKSVHAMIGDDLYYYCEFKNERSLPISGYFVLIDQNDSYRVYKKFSLKIKDPEKANSPFGGEKSPGKIKQLVSYYMEHNGRILEIPTDKNTFFDLFEDKKTELKDFMASEKLRLKKEEHIIALISKYNELVSINGQQLQTALAAKMD